MSESTNDTGAYYAAGHPWWRSGRRSGALVVKGRPKYKSISDWRAVKAARGNPGPRPLGVSTGASLDPTARLMADIAAGGPKPVAIAPSQLAQKSGGRAATRGDARRTVLEDAGIKAKPWVQHGLAPRKSVEHASSTSCSRGSASGQRRGRRQRASSRSSSAANSPWPRSPRPMKLPRVCGASGDSGRSRCHRRRAPRVSIGIRRRLRGVLPRKASRAVSGDAFPLTRFPNQPEPRSPGVGGTNSGGEPARDAWRKRHKGAPRASRWGRIVRLTGEGDSQSLEGRDARCTRDPLASWCASVVGAEGCFGSRACSSSLALSRSF